MAVAEHGALLRAAMSERRRRNPNAEGNYLTRDMQDYKSLQSLLELLERDRSPFGTTTLRTYEAARLLRSAVEAIAALDRENEQLSKDLAGAIVRKRHCEDALREILHESRSLYGVSSQGGARQIAREALEKLR